MLKNIEPFVAMVVLTTIGELPALVLIPKIKKTLTDNKLIAIKKWMKVKVLVHPTNLVFVSALLHNKRILINNLSNIFFYLFINLRLLAIFQFDSFSVRCSVSKPILINESLFEFLRFSTN